MTQTTNNYDRLYENMKQRFTVATEDNQYTLGEYMLMKAGCQKTESASSLPVAVKTAVTKSEMAVSNIVTFVDDKLTIKQAPVKDKTIKSFPLRASASAFFTAAVACAFMLSFALIGFKALSTPAPASETLHNQIELNVSEIDFN